MNAYVCVYRQPATDAIRRGGWKKTNQVAFSGHLRKHERLRKYLGMYESAFYGEEQGRFYDWGDDPSFFAAEEFLGNVRRATWAVCRPDVRSNILKGDFVVFFCAQQRMDYPDIWNYYYIGVGTVGQVIANHKAIWQKKKYRGYRKFYNLLVDSSGYNRETIYPRHDEKGKKCKYRWQELAKGPYIIFDTSPDKTHFNVIDPLHVATYGERKNHGDVLERWRLKSRRVKRIYRLIPKRKNGGAKLRTRNKYRPYRHMNLSNELEHDIRRLKKTRESLLKISKEIAAK